MDDILLRATAAGASVVAASDRRWGYAGFFTDPDRHYWETLCNPGVSKQDG